MIEVIPSGKKFNISKEGCSINLVPIRINLSKSEIVFSVKPTDSVAYTWAVDEK